jgi:hypothetical protein
MKIYIRCIIALLFTVSCGTSKNSQLLEVGKFSLKVPKEAVKITHEDLDSKNPSQQMIKKLTNMNIIYKINDVYFGMLDPFKGEIKKDYLKDSKKGFDYLHKDFGTVESEQYKSSLAKINNNDVFVRYRFDKNIGQYTFKMVNKDYNQMFSGVIFFENQSNYEEATKILDDLLKSVKFE